MTSQEAKDPFQSAVNVHDHNVLNCLHLEATQTRSPTDEQHPKDRFALLVMNGDTDEFFPQLWHNAAVRILADGGANRVYDSVPEARDRLLPDAVIGDMDSARTDVLHHYQRHGIPVIEDPDQDSTDMHKALDYLYNNYLHPSSKETPAFNTIIIYAALGGRLDQQIAALSTLSRYTPRFTEQHIILLSEGNLVEHLAPGKHFILMNPVYEAKGQHCGLFTVEQPASRVTTKGLRWNLSQHHMQQQGAYDERACYG